MEAQERANCLRIFILVAEFIKEGLTNLIEFHTSNNAITFEDFINQHQHDIYHHCYISACCQCLSGQRYRGPTNRVLNPPQLIVLFGTHGQKLAGHNARPNDNFCCSKAKTGVCEKDIDITLARFLLTNYCIELFWHPFNTFEDFLNSHKHDIFHMCFGNSRCCLCIGNYQCPPTVPCFKNEWTKLFVSRNKPCVNCMVSSSVSVCSISAIPGINEKHLNPKTVQILRQHCSQVWKTIVILKDIRNKMFGHIMKVRVTDTDFESTWANTKKALLIISDICGNTVETQERLDTLKQRSLDETLLKQYQITLQELLRHDEWKEVFKTFDYKLETVTDKQNEMDKKFGEKVETVAVGLKEIGDKLETVSGGLKEVEQKCRVKLETASVGLKEVEQRIGRKLETLSVKLKEVEQKIGNKLETTSVGLIEVDKKIRDRLETVSAGLKEVDNKVCGKLETVSVGLLNSIDLKVGGKLDTASVGLKEIDKNIGDDLKSQSHITENADKRLQCEVQILKDFSAIAKMCTLMDDSQTDNVNCVMNEACSEGNLEVVKSLLKFYGPQMFSADELMKSTFASGNFDIVALLLNTFDHDLFNAEIVLKSAMNNACRCGTCGNIYLIKFLLETFGYHSIDVKNAMNEACRSGNVDVVMFVLDTFDVFSIDIKNAMNEACRSGNVDLVKFVLNTFGCRSIDVQNTMNEACRSGNVDLVKFVLNTFGCRSIDVQNAMNEACRSGNVDLVKFVLDRMQ